MGSLAVLPLVVIFIACAAAIWVAGIRLSATTDVLDARLGLGSALGGLILLAIATNLPEVAITVTAALKGNLDLAIGNLIGGIAIQTVVLALLDFSLRGDRPLSYHAASLVLVLEATMVVAIVAVAVMATQLPGDASAAGLSPATVVIVMLWAGGLLVINRARKGLPWVTETPGAAPGQSAHERARGKVPARAQADPAKVHQRPTKIVALFFAVACLVTLVAGYFIEESGSALAARMGLGGAVFGATILAAATSLPEVSTGLAATRFGDHQLAMSDIFGGNAFLPTLFILADLIAGKAALPGAKATDIWLAGLGVALTVIYVAGLVLRPEKRRGRLGADSIAVVSLYALGILGLFLIS